MYDNFFDSLAYSISLEANNKKSTRPSPDPHRELDAKLDLIRPFLNIIIVNFSRTTDCDIERKDQQNSGLTRQACQGSIDKTASGR